eukprot:TRINITY_DN4371_c0_g1_i5.p4 TRINITY_DN4371_c0_g1~~TRINITY_DN4371_c0_g1_i5.p4  ORF type:complete len:168 (-),score=3.98 TRINITY_DN4371_c0_g1_i5:222-725(-)
MQQSKFSRVYCLIKNTIYVRQREHMFLCISFQGREELIFSSVLEVFIERGYICNSRNFLVCIAQQRYLIQRMYVRLREKCSSVFEFNRFLFFWGWFQLDNIYYVVFHLQRRDFFVVSPLEMDVNMLVDLFPFRCLVEIKIQKFVGRLFSKVFCYLTENFQIKSSDQY